MRYTNNAIALTDEALTSYLITQDSRYRAEPIYNDWAVAADPTIPLRVMGYTLIGPRGHKGVVMRDPVTGLFDLATVSLWCEGVSYVTEKAKSSTR